MIDLRELANVKRRSSTPSFRAGDTVKVNVRVKEGDRERIQAFQGVVIKVVGGTTTGATFTVRRISSGVGIERTFFINSPLVEKIELVRNGDVRRARLFYLRSLSGRAARIKEKARKIAGLAEAIAVEPEPSVEPAPVPAAETPAAPASAAPAPAAAAPAAAQAEAGDKK